MVNRHPPRKLIPYRTPKANPDAGGAPGLRMGGPRMGVVSGRLKHRTASGDEGSRVRYR